MPYSYDVDRVAPIRLSRRDNEPLHWCSAYIRSRRFSSSVTPRPLYDDHHHTVRRNALLHAFLNSYVSTGVLFQPSCIWNKTPKQER